MASDGCVSKGPGGGLDRGTSCGLTELRRGQAILVRSDLGPKDLWRPRYCSKVHGSVRHPAERPAPLRFARLIQRPATAEQRLAARHSITFAAVDAHS
jgi:hypothetical protein